AGRERFAPHSDTCASQRDASPDPKRDRAPAMWPGPDRISRLWWSVGGHPHHGLGERLAAHRAEEGGVTEGEDAAVGGVHPVAVARRGRGHADDRLVERLAAHRAEEAGVTEGEDAAVGGVQPVALAG